MNLHESRTPGRAAPAPATIDIEYFTDPLSAWSWAFEPVWRAVRWRYPGRIRWRYRLIGMVTTWGGFEDPISNVSRPGQMGPHWAYVTQSTGQPIEPGLWVESPPRSSLPACLAVKAAALQSPDAAEAYLRAAREAALVCKQDIAEEDRLLKIAREIERMAPRAFNARRFEHDLHDQPAKDALRADLEKARYFDFTRVPALTITGPDAPPMILAGYRPLDTLERALLRAGGALTPRSATDISAYVAAWGRCTVAEVGVACGLPWHQAQAALAEAVESGNLARDGHFYSSKHCNHTPRTAGNELAAAHGK